MYASVGSSNNMMRGSNSLINTMNRNNKTATIASTQAATGNKINSAADGASKWAISQKMRTMIRAQSQAIENAQTDTAIVRTVQNALSNQLEILTTLRERAINAANDSNSSSERAKIAAEVNEYLSQIDDIANNTSFNNKHLLNGNISSGSDVGATTPTGVTATGTYGNMAVYGVTGLATKSGAAIAGTTNLVDLVGKNGETLFQEGDKVTLSWTENGTSKSYDVTVASNTTLADLDGGNVTAQAVTSGSAIGSAKDANGDDVKAGATGLYFTGAANTNISNFSIAVTSSAGATRTAAQEALQPTAIQQSYGSKTQGSNAVYNASGVTATHTVGTDTANNSNSTAFYLFGSTGTDSGKDSASSTYTLTVDGQEIKFAGSSTINDINNMLKESGINVRLQYTATAGETLYYDGTAVTQGTYGSTMAYKSQAGLNIIAGPGQTPSTIKLTGDGTASYFKSGDKKIDTTDTTGKNTLNKALELDTTGTGTSSASLSSLPKGDTYHFHVSGEANFGMNKSMPKATVGAYFGMSKEHFASMFLTVEGAQQAIGITENAMDMNLSAQTDLGATEKSLGYIQTSLEDLNTNQQEAVDTIITADLASAMVNYTKSMIQVQASQGMLGNIFNLAGTDVNAFVRP